MTSAPATAAVARPATTVRSVELNDSELPRTLTHLTSLELENPHDRSLHTSPNFLARSNNLAAKRSITAANNGRID